MIVLYAQEKGIETVVDGLGGLKGILTVLGPLMINLFSSNIGQVAAQMFNNFTINSQNAAKLQELSASLEVLKTQASGVTERYLGLKEALGGMAKYMSPEQYNTIAQAIEAQAKAEADVVDKTTQRLNAEEKLIEVQDKLNAKKDEIMKMRTKT